MMIESSNLVDGPNDSTPLDPDELDGLKFKHISTKGELDQLEQAGITEGLQWLAKQKKPDVLSEAFVLELHKRLFGSVWKWAGKFRRTEKNLGVDPIQIAIQLRQLDLKLHQGLFVCKIQVLSESVNACLKRQIHPIQSVRETN